MFLTLQKFLDYFPIIDITKEELVDKLIVSYHNMPTLRQLFTLSESNKIIKSDNDIRYIKRDEIISYFYELLITNRHLYLTYFYNSYFKFDNPYNLKWDNFNILNDKINTISLQKNDNSRVLIRNLNYLDILHNTLIINTCKSKTSFWQTFINAYNNLILEDRFFAPSSLELFLRKKATSAFNYNNFFYLIQQYQPKASILNPYTINWILKNIFNGKKLLTPVLSWGSYLMAFMHSNYEKYVGIDVMPEICERVNYLYNYYSKLNLSAHTNKSIEIICKPSESLLDDKKYLLKYSNYFDSVLLCPPYFNMEIYPSGEQSIKLYPKYEDWLLYYWENTLKMIKLSCINNAKIGIILNDYETLKKQSYPLINDMTNIALRYFKLINSYYLVNRASPLRMNVKKRTEMLFIYENI